MANKFAVFDELIEDLFDLFAIGPVGFELVEDMAKAGSPVRLVPYISKEGFL